MRRVAGRWSLVAGAVVLVFALPLFASISVRRSPYNAKTIDVYIVNERVTDAIGSIEMYLPKPVEMIVADDRVITYRAKEVSPERALRVMASLGKTELTSDEDRYWVRSSGELTVTLDVKDAETREILKSMQRQCGIRNLIVDPDVVQGSGTFYFVQVPCKQAFNVVFQSLGLSAQTYSNNLVSVGAAPH